jgi:type I restriction enzyme S subunit
MDDSATLLKQEFYKLPEGWKWLKLGEVAKINKEQRNPALETPNEKFIYIDISGVENGTGRIREVKQILGKDAPSRARRVVHTNDVIMSTVRPYLKALALIPEEYDNQICSTGFAVLTCIDKIIIPKYLLYVLFSDIVIEQCNRMMAGAHYPALRESQIPQILIPLPPLEEQRRIVARIEELLSRVEEAKRLRKQAREETEKIMQAALHKVFSRAEEKGWEWVELKNVAKVVGGHTPKRSVRRYWNGNIPWLVPTELSSGTIEIVQTSKEKITQEGLKNSSTMLLPAGSVLYTSRATIGKVAIAGVPLTTNQGFTNFICTNRLYNWYLAYCLLWLTPQIQKEAGQTTFLEIRKSRLRKFKIPLPPLEEQKKIATYFTNIQETLKQLKKFQQETEKELEKLVPSILDKAFKGQL